MVQSAREGLSKKTTCVVFSKTDSNYKCPKCLEKYCSIACYKTHKESCLPISKPKTDQALKEHDNEDLELDEDEVVVENFRLEKAKNSYKLRPYLSHSKLRKIIR